MNSTSSCRSAGERLAAISAATAALPRLACLQQGIDTLGVDQLAQRRREGPQAPIRHQLADPTGGHPQLPASLHRGNPPLTDPRPLELLAHAVLLFPPPGGQQKCPRTTRPLGAGAQARALPATGGATA